MAVSLFGGFVRVLPPYTLALGRTDLRRLFSTFARGWPGAGLLFMRVVAGFALVAEWLTVLRAQPVPLQMVIGLVMVAAGICIIAGLWTPVVGSLVAAFEAWNAFATPGDPWTHILLGTLGGALALLGPGAWSIDARLFGWKRIDIREHAG